MTDMEPAKTTKATETTGLISHPEGTATGAQLTLNLVVCGLGTGILTLPWSLAGASLIFGVAIIAAVLVVNAWTILLLVEAAETYQVFDIGGLLAHLPGRLGHRAPQAVNAAIWVSGFLCLVSYVLVLADCGQPFLLAPSWRLKILVSLLARCDDDITEDFTGCRVGSFNGSQPEGKVAVITGASAGIGLSTVEGLARSGIYGTIVMAGRDSAKHQEAMESLREKLSALARPVELRFLELDLASLASVRSFEAEFRQLKKPLHTLLLNAGVMALPERQQTADGYEYQFGVNHLGHFLLCNLLLDALHNSGGSSDPSRVIVLSSSAHQFPSKLLKGDLTDLQSFEYAPWTAYGQSKLANLMFAYELDRRLRERGLRVVANAVHPGVVNTELFRHAGGKASGFLNQLTKPVLPYVMKSPADGAKTSVLLATEDLGKLSGRYWQDGRPTASVDFDPASNLPAPAQALLPFPKLTSYDPAVWGELWEESELLVGLRAEDVKCL
ncbi:unnamed protein product [Effrenium voratum]|nr:unnamed protein product [Effrenium voratum]